MRDVVLEGFTKGGNDLSLKNRVLNGLHYHEIPKHRLAQSPNRPYHQNCPLLINGQSGFKRLHQEQGYVPIDISIDTSSDSIPPICRELTVQYRRRVIIL